jgi:hypothetical protein
MQLSTHDLRAMLRHTPDFVGVFPLNGIPPLIPPRKRIKMIVNLDLDSQPGSHWVAIYRRADGNALYLDSFGRKPPPLIEQWLCKNTLSWKVWNKPIQKPHDRTSCGYICASFLKKLH